MRSGVKEENKDKENSLITVAKREFKTLHAETLFRILISNVRVGKAEQGKSARRKKNKTRCFMIKS